MDYHNQARQFELALEKHWITQTGYFQFFTSMLGIVITDAWKAYKHHLHERHKHKQVEIESFANLLASNMLHNKFSTLTLVDKVLYISRDKSFDLNENDTNEELFIDNSQRSKISSSKNVMDPLSRCIT